MHMMDFIKRMIRSYFIIFAVVVIMMTLLRQFFTDYRTIELKDIYIYMACSLAADLTSLIMYSKKELTERQNRIRMILQFAALETVLLGLAGLTGWISGAKDAVVLAIQIAIVAVIVRFVSFRGDQTVADRINQQLNAMNKEP